MHQFTFTLDDDDARAIHEAIALYQTTRRVSLYEPGATGVLLSDGESDLRGAILAEICRSWMETVDEGGGDEPY